MKIRENWLKAALAASLTAAMVIPLAAFAKPGHGKHGGKGFSIARVVERNAERLDLDADTLKRIQEVSAAHKVKLDALREASRREHTVMRELLSQPSPSEPAVLQQAEVLGRLRTDRHKQQLQSWLEIRSMLTPAQLQELQELREEQRERFKERRRERRGNVEQPEAGAL